MWKESLPRESKVNVIRGWWFWTAPFTCGMAPCTGGRDMKGAFSMDSRLYKVVDKAVSMIKLNLLFAVFSLPVITIGAAGCALYDTAMKIAANEEGYILHNFLKVFRSKWRQSLKVWAFLLIAFAGLCANFLFWTNQQGTVPEMMLGAVLMLMVFWFFLTVYSFALMAGMETSAKTTLRNAAFLAVKHLPKSFYMLLWTLILAAAGWLWTPVMLAELLAGMAVSAVIHGRVLVKVLEEEGIASLRKV